MPTINTKPQPPAATAATGDNLSASSVGRPSRDGDDGRTSVTHIDGRTSLQGDARTSLTHMDGRPSVAVSTVASAPAGEESAAGGVRLTRQGGAREGGDEWQHLHNGNEWQCTSNTSIRCSSNNNDNRGWVCKSCGTCHAGRGGCIGTEITVFVTCRPELGGCTGTAVTVWIINVAMLHIRLHHNRNLLPPVHMQGLPQQVPRMLTTLKRR
jgi:hypothetical protein